MTSKGHRTSGEYFKRPQISLETPSGHQRLSETLTVPHRPSETLKWTSEILKDTQIPLNTPSDTLTDPQRPSETLRYTHRPSQTLTDPVWKFQDFSISQILHEINF